MDITEVVTDAKTRRMIESILNGKDDDEDDEEDVEQDVGKPAPPAADEAPDDQANRDEVPDEPLPRDEPAQRGKGGKARKHSAIAKPKKKQNCQRT